MAGLHAPVPLIAFLGLMHLPDRVAALLFLVELGCLNDGGIDQGATWSS